MSLLLDRRSLVRAGLLGAGALAVPGNAAALLAARGFTHGVASGEPRQHSVILWTRYVPPRGDSARLQWQVSATPDFARVLRSGEVRADAAHDHTAKPVVRGLRPGRWYYYRFRNGRGGTSPVGRTRTLPDGPVDRFRLALFSCSNIGFGFFNAYAHAAARRDLDLAVHVGDYLYEYEIGTYPGRSEAVRPAAIDPANEIVQLADYRLRHAAYRADPDLQQLHRMLPMVAMWDDHEVANNSWHGGAQNHQPESEGPWTVRKAAALRAWREWMPVGEPIDQAYEIGELATLILPETRLTARSEPLSVAAAVRGQTDVAAALRRFRDETWSDPARTMLGAPQEARLAQALRQSVARGTKWQVLAQQVVMGSVSTPPESARWTPPSAPAAAHARAAVGLAASRLGLPYNLDAWDGYPAARSRLLRSALEADSELVVLSGDSHNAWAFDLDLDGARAGVEVGGQSVTSPGLERTIPTVPPADLARAIVAHNRQLKWADLGRRGYATVELTPARMTAEWLFGETVRHRSPLLSARHVMTAEHGARRYST